MFGLKPKKTLAESAAEIQAGLNRPLTAIEVEILGGVWNAARVTREFADGSFGRLENADGAMTFVVGREG